MEDYVTDFIKVDQIFREQHDEILKGIEGVLAQHGITGYRVTRVAGTTQAEPPAPIICLPYCYLEPGDGWVCGWWCTSSPPSDNPAVGDTEAA